MNTAPTRTATVQTYDSVADLLAACSDAWTAGRRGLINDASWVGRRFSEWSAVAAAAVAPWQEGLDTVFGMLHALDAERSKLPPPVDVRRRKRWSPDDGDEVCIDRLRAGADYWQGMSRQETRAPRQVTIVANTCANSGVPHDQILWRGAAAIALADLAEAAGYRVELWSCDYSESGGENAFIGARLKAMDEPLDTVAVVNAMAGWFFRTVYFQASGVDPAMRRHAQGARRAESITADLDVIQELARGSTAIVSEGIFSYVAALSWVRKTIETLNEVQS